MAQLSRSVLLNLSILCLIQFATMNCKNMTMTEKLQALREQMKNSDCDAVIIPSEDEHQSEYVADYDMRRAWLTGFTGSAGVAVVTADKGLLWTDSRYYIQANKQLDPAHWTLMRAAEKTTQTIEEYLNSKLTADKRVCQDPRYISIARWQRRETLLKEANVKLVDTSDLVDKIWPVAERPSKPNTEVYIHESIYAGQAIREKITLVKEKINEAKADFYVVTALDDVAWLFNIRASDIPYNPMFFAYAIIDGKGGDYRLYINSSRPGFSDVQAKHLNGILIKPYDEITKDITALSGQQKTIWISPSSSYAIYNAVSDKKLLVNDKASPVRGIKAVKTEMEMTNFRECQIRDSIARIRHMYWLETQMSAGERITEKSAAKKLEDIQSEDPLFRSLSFESISAVGANAAVVHYATSEGDDSVLEKEKVYLLDAGAQYLDCTTDITRTLHFGTPSKKEILAYTGVMQGSIDLSNMYFPEGVYGQALDVEARATLWRNGLDYGHGTGHGIGYFLSVHEAPPGIAYNSRSQFDAPLQVGMVSSDEPGYYEEGVFGIRLETDIEVVEAKTEFTFQNKKTLKFESLTLVPFERKLINECLLTKAQVLWLNEYNNQIREKVQPRLGLKYQNYLSEKTRDFVNSYQNPKCSDYNGNNSIKLKQTSFLLILSVSLAVLKNSFF